MFQADHDCPCLETCPLHYAMALVGGKWKMQIICSLNNKGPLRYNALKRMQDNISNTALANALKELEQAGLVERTEYLEVPVRVEYALTEQGDALMPALEVLSEWGERMLNERRKQNTI